ncbi:MAG: ankryin [Chthonomonadaceae bacterium]|nr:ankryin [Chthonomonadaceae bacterium]
MPEELTPEEQAKLDADLIAAIKASDTALVIALLEQGADPNITTEFDPWGFGPRTVSALMLAISWFCRRETSGWDTDSTEEFNDPLVRALIEGGASLNPTPPKDDEPPLEEPPLYAVVGFGELCPNRYELVAFMLDRGADIDGIHVCHTALYRACGQRDIEMLRLLLDHGANINPQTLYGSPLMYAVAISQKDAVELLLARGADVHYRSARGETALSQAKGKRGGGAQIRRMLEAAGAKPDLLEQECKRLIKTVEETGVLDTTVGDRWRELWHANLEGEHFNRARIHHVHLLCRLGALLALYQDDPTGAIDLLDRALSHPGITALPPHEHSELYGDRLYALLSADREAEAIAMALQLMKGEIAGRSIGPELAANIVGEALEDYFGTLAGRHVVVLLSTAAATHMHDFGTLEGSRAPVSRELTDLTWDVSQQLRRRPLKKRRLPEQATPQELYTLLQRRG